MKLSGKYNLSLLALIVSILFSCREPLISSADETKEALIQGSWIFQNESGSIYLNFNSDLAVNIVVINSAGSSEFTFNFRVEDGDLYFLLVEDNEEVEFVYTIVSLTPFELVLSFVDTSGLLTTQTYVRP